MKIVDLRSDTVTRPSQAMREVIANAEVGDDVFGDDPTVIKLQEMIAELLGKPAGIFFPSGTMSNQVGLRCLTDRGDEVIIEANAHIFRYEAASGAAINGLQFNTIEGNRGVITVGQIERRIRPTNDEHQPLTTLVCLENTHNRAGGALFPLDEIERIRELCLKHGIKTYLDGARLWNASAASGIPLNEYTKHFDLVSVCLSKGLGAPIGSVLVGDEKTIVLARRYRKAYGGGMRQVGIIAAAGMYAVEHNLHRLKDDHARAKKIAGTLKDLPGIKLHPVETNIVIFDVSGLDVTPEKIEDDLRERGLLIVGMGGGLLRAVCHLDVDDSDIDLACGIFEDYFKG
ncbi:MAG: aminotransferase class I/II-fold pyridoxal phosphate-dependent enzyme [candidate division Zixibacteria bacterium]|nr:aminotransferase class I/II-fold pyridoxal phosphate-dependent enzyme [candidate division Zixibacteria bacterium]